MSDAPHIWTRRPKILEPKSELVIAPRVGGWYRMQVIRPDGRVRKDTGWFPNLITNAGLNLIGTSQSWVETCVVGTSNTAPSFTDTALVAQIGATSNRTARTGASNQTADRYCYGQVTFRFAAGTATGNLAEVGIYSQTTLFSRALILDGSGNPATITVLADEALDVTYQVRNYPPLTDATGTIMIGSTSHDYVLRTAVAGSWDVLGGGLGAPIGWMAGVSTFGQGSLYPSTSTLGSVTGSPSGAGSGSSGGTTDSYGSGSYFRDFSYTWNLTSGNVSGGAAAVLVPCGSQPSGGGEAQAGCYFQFSVNPVIPKDGTNNLSLSFRQAWARR